ncbi:MAG: lamin tail domain-containing protein [Patescibacteria group bacterium]
MSTQHPLPRRILAAALSLMFIIPWGAMPLPARAQTSQVVIEEIAWAGSSASTADEWIELANLGSATTTIGGWSLHGAGTSERVIYLPPDAEIPPYGTYLISNYAMSDASSALNTDVQLATTTVSLSNSALGIELVDASGNLIDRAGNGSVPLAGSTKPFATMQRASSTLSGDQSSAWTSATTSVNFKNDVVDLGTPGICDLCIITDQSDNAIVVSDEMTSDTLIDEMNASSTDLLADATSTFIDEMTDQITSDTAAMTDLETTSTEEIIAFNATDVAFNATTSIALSEVVSNPPSGHEWVELFFDGDATSTDRDLLLYDSENKIATIPAGTALTLPHFLVYFISSSKLNNDGDAISLRETNGTVINETPIPALNKGEALAKDIDDTWSLTVTPTPGADNVITPRPVTTNTTQIITITSPSNSMVPNKTESGEQKAVSGKKTAATNSTSTAASLAKSTKVAKTTKSTASKSTTSTTSTSVGTKTTKKTSTIASNTTTSTKMATKKVASNATTKKSASSIALNANSYTFTDMFDPSFNAARVRVSGTVATPSRFFGATHAFILLNEDGRGVIVYLPKHLNVPTLGSSVNVEGTISSTYLGPEIHMKTTDVWMSVATTTAPKPRTVDFLMPSAEDAWSLVTVDGTVTTVGASSVQIVTDDGIDVTIPIPTVVGFRTKRLKKDDRIRVTGLLNIKKDTPTIMPPSADDISIIAYAPNTTETISATSTHAATSTGLPNWIPFASAAGAVGATGAGKRLRELIRKRKLKMMMEGAKR